MRLLIIILFTLSPALYAEHTVTTAVGDEIPITVHAAKGQRLILWLPSEFGVSERRRALAERLADDGNEVWSPDLHAAWFLPVGRYSLNGVDPAAIAAIIDDAVTHSGKQVYLMAEGRSVALALHAVRHWQQHTSDTSRLAGLLAFSPKLFVRTPQGGDSAEYLPIVSASNLPIYLLQPMDAGGFWRTGEAVGQLEKGGSAVFVHTLPGVSDGFHARSEFTDKEGELTRRLPTILRGAMQQLAGLGGTPGQVAEMRAGPLAPQKPDSSALLQAFAGERQAPALRLPDLQGKQVDLATLRGRVVLVNFWATWCPPCVEEIPSLQRLYARLQPRGLEILAVDVGEDADTMGAFLADKPVAFPVLMDSQAEALKRWGVYAFPTTLVLDRAHRIRYAVFGAFDWSSQEVIDALSPLLDVNPA